MKKILCTLITIILTNSLYSQNFTIDTDFNIGSGFNDSAIVNQISIQQDGKIIVAGSNFLQLNAVNISSNIIRLNSNGTLDIQFTNLITVPKTIAIQSDGKIIIAGDSSTNNTRIVRYNSDGTIDNTFSVGNNASDGFNIAIDEVAIESDGRILVKGDFTTFSGNSIKRLVRLNNNGTLSFGLSGISYNIRCFALLNSGKILVSEYGSNNIKRLNVDGTIDNSYFDLTNRGSFLFKEQANGSIISTWRNPSNDIEIVKLLVNGSLDNSYTNFNAPTGSGLYVGSVTNLPNNKILVTNVAGSNTTQGNLFILNANGTEDVSNNFGTGFDSFNYANSIKIQSDNKIILGGNFNSYNGVTKYSLIRLVNGTLSTQLDEINKFSIFPNPAKDIIRISNIKNFTYGIYNLVGEQIVSKNNVEEEINISSLSNGMYIIKIENEGKISIQKFIKN